MDQERFFQLMANPENLEKDDVAKLEKIVADLPYFEAARLLYQKGLKTTENLLYQQELGKTAIHTKDRKALYNLLIGNSLRASIQEFETTIQVQETDKKEVAQPEDKVETAEVKADFKKTQQDETPLPDEELEFLENEITTEAVHNAYIREMQNMPTEEIEKKTDQDVESQASEMIELDIQHQFVRSGRLSFTEWLQIDQKDSSKTEKKEEFNKLIDKFIQEDPTIEVKKAEFFSAENLVRMSDAEDESFVTETLAKIYLKQGKREKAIKAFKHLQLKYPEKSIYFAALIEKTEELN